MLDVLAWTAVLAYAASLLLLLPFALYRGALLRLSGRAAPKERARWAGPLPRVTVQLPLFNEKHVVERLIDASCRLDYPNDLLEIQLLDDSTDETTCLARALADDWRRRGLDIDHIRRPKRAGYKAGALASGMARAKGEFLLVLDADFVPGTSLIRQLLAPMADPRVGMTQARWDHLNSDESWLTRAQGTLLDGHFFLEHGGKYRGGLFFNFNGTAGLWRRRALEDAGGWRSDALTEDLDASYRAQMAGWRFVFMEDVAAPAELPAAAAALLAQQRRWAQGAIQTGRKLLGQLVRGPWSFGVKASACLHLLGPFAHPLAACLALLIAPAALARSHLGLDGLWWLDLAAATAASVPFALFYGHAARRRRASYPAAAGSVALALALGSSLSLFLARSVLRGLRGAGDPFVRTPKAGSLRQVSYMAEASGARAAPLALAMAALLVAGAVLLAASGKWASLPFIGIFLCGYLLLGFELLKRPDCLRGQRKACGSPEKESRPEGLGPDPARLIIGPPPVPKKTRAAKQKEGPTLFQRGEGKDPEDVPRMDDGREQEGRAQGPEDRVLASLDATSDGGGRAQKEDCSGNPWMKTLPQQELQRGVRSRVGLPPAGVFAQSESQLGGLPVQEGQEARAKRRQEDCNSFGSAPTKQDRGKRGGRPLYEGGAGKGESGEKARLSRPAPVSGQEHAEPAEEEGTRHVEVGVPRGLDEQEGRPEEENQRRPGIASGPLGESMEDDGGARLEEEADRLHAQDERERAGTCSREEPAGADSGGEERLSQRRVDRSDLGMVDAFVPGRAQGRELRARRDVRVRAHPVQR